MKKRTLNEIRQVKTYGYRPPSPSRKKESEEKEIQDRKGNGIGEPYSKDLESAVERYKKEL